MDDKPYDKNVTIQQRIDDITKKIESLQERRARLEQVKEHWLKLRFKEGDAAFHREHGNVLIKSIEFGSKDEEIDVIKYNIVTLHKGTQKVPFTELVEISEVTKILYTEKA